jgi:hypothetical protein
MGRTCSTYRKLRNAYKIYVGNSLRVIIDWLLGNKVGSCGLDSAGSG